MKLRDYQKDTIAKTIGLLNLQKFGYLRAQPRTGKSIMSLLIMGKLGYKNTLVLTTGKAMPDIKKDLATIKANAPNWKAEHTFTTYHSAYKLQGQFFDSVILDEAHNLKAYNQDQKLGKFQYEVRNLLDTIDGAHLFMSGTPAPENELGYFRQFWCSKHCSWSNFIWPQWHRQFGRTTYEQMGDRQIPTFHAKSELIEAQVKQWSVDLSQVDAGFKHTIVEHEILVPFCDEIYDLALKLKTSPMVSFKGLALDSIDPSAKRVKMHALCGGMVMQDKDYVLIDDSKMKWIESFIKRGKRIAIYHYFIHEGKALRERFKDVFTDDIEVYASGAKSVFIGQVKRDSCGVRLSTADALIVYSMDYSATNYFQWRDRLTHLDRDVVDIYFLYNDKLNLDQAVKASIDDKKNYTLKMFERDFLETQKRIWRI